ncbi:hypothetical protein TRICHSKD4_3584 [Roseibium sp. TrichSKD4]|nr:hypothetical protein TRICHSKD4_3584 [Roseibium sp. TrichSKD4]
MQNAKTGRLLIERRPFFVSICPFASKANCKIKKFCKILLIRILTKPLLFWAA